MYTYAFNIRLSLIMVLSYILTYGQLLALLLSFAHVSNAFMALLAVFFFPILMEKLETFLDGPVIPGFILLLGIQRFIVLFADDKYHQFVTGTILKIYLNSLILIAIAYMVWVNHDVERLHLIGEACQKRMIFSHYSGSSNYTMATPVSIQVHVSCEIAFEH
ncbi:unnamed protein product [Caenorhabditis bovis]|uniref:Uncharacterized protein n=1 Tax=Caenorhabditis bovis TaxID=2654633 RepID=A0A8S1EMH6_9PELO|nr:unnamed protein product [Caenorhabditis bovis]